MGYFEEIQPAMDRYLEKAASAEPEILQRLRRETYQKTTQPHMLSGHQQGRLLSLISQLRRPKNILEIGTFTGYAALCLAEGLAPGGRLTTLDINEDLSWLPQKYFAESAYANRIDFRLEDARDFLKKTTETFDLIFIDADKESYPEYFSLLKNRVAPGGVVLFDNVLWYGKVLEERPTQKATQAIQQLNEQIAADPDFVNLILPLRDGVNLLLKKE